MECEVLWVPVSAGKRHYVDVISSIELTWVLFSTAVAGASATIASDALMNPFDGESERLKDLHRLLELRPHQ
jgi:hypothetical protein